MAIDFGSKKRLSVIRKFFRGRMDLVQWFTSALRQKYTSHSQFIFFIFKQILIKFCILGHL